MVRTAVLTILIVIGAAVGGYALWSASSTAEEAVVEACDGAATTACASAMEAGCAGCPSAMPAESGAAVQTEGTVELAESGCGGCPSQMSPANAEACTEACTEDTKCMHGDECPCGGDPANCTDEMKEACGEKCPASSATEATAACGSAESAPCGGGRCEMGKTAADAS